MKQNIVIATTKSWNIEAAKKLKKELSPKYQLTIITNKQQLTSEKLNKIKPLYIFFPHWSWIIPKSIWKKHKCIVFHMTDLPFGRGGSPLQNLLIRGIYKTKVSALQVEVGLDTGPIYIKRNLLLKTGNATQMLSRSSKLIFQKMIPYILKNSPKPISQIGKPTNFFRRKATESNLLSQKFDNINKIYDFIRMLDGEGYPNSFITLKNGEKIKFTQAKLKNKKISGIFEIYEKK